MQDDRTKIEERLNLTRENYRMMPEPSLKIVHWEPPKDHLKANLPYKEDVVEAARQIVTLDLALLKAEIECRICHKPLAEIVEGYAYDPLPGEIRAVVIAAWARVGLLPQPIIEQIVPAANSQTVAPGRPNVRS